MKIRLTKKDTKILFDELENPSKPNKALKKAALKYLNGVISVSGSTSVCEADRLDSNSR